MKEASAFCPANISCIFRLYEDDDPLKKGSLGVGFTIDKGVTVRVMESQETKIILNDIKINFPTINSVISYLTDKSLEVNIKSDVPLGAGFGVSGASALATAYAVNELLNLCTTNEELALLAHRSEVENSSGRGDVGAQFNGGILIKTEEGKPLEAEKMNIELTTVYYKVFGEIDTKEVIDSAEKMKRINSAGDTALNAIQADKNLDFARLIEISKNFSIESGLLTSKKVIDVIEEVENNGGRASMIMLGESVFSNIPFVGCSEAKIVDSGARML